MSIADTAAQAPTAVAGRVSQPARQWLRSAVWLLLAVATAAIVRWWLTAPVVMEVVQPFSGPLVVEAFGTGTLEAKVVAPDPARFENVEVIPTSTQVDILGVGVAWVS